MISDFWLKIVAIGAIIAGALAWRQKGINNAVGREKAKSRIEESKIHIEKMEKEKENAKTVREIENLISQLDDDDVSDRLRAFRD